MPRLRLWAPLGPTHAPTVGTCCPIADLPGGPPGPGQPLVPEQPGPHHTQARRGGLTSSGPPSKQSAEPGSEPRQGLGNGSRDHPALRPENWLRGVRSPTPHSVAQSQGHPPEQLPHCGAPAPPWTASAAATSSTLAPGGGGGPRDPPRVDATGPAAVTPAVGARPGPSRGRARRGRPAGWGSFSDLARRSHTFLPKPQ